MDLTVAHVIITFVYITINETDAELQTRCLKTTSSSSELPLQCSSNHWIHVISKTLSSKTLSNGSCPDTEGACVAILTNQENGLNVSSNGKETSIEDVQLSSSSCKPVEGSKIAYGCIDGSMSICCGDITQSVNSSVYLHSPGFPKTDVNNNSCSCKISGNRMEVMVIENHSVDSVVTISTDNMKNIWSGFSACYNNIIVSDSADVVINYDNSVQNGGIWIRVKGSGRLDISCVKELSVHIEVSEDIFSTSSHLKITTAQHYTPYITTDGPPVTDESPKTTVITAILAAVCGFLVFVTIAFTVASYRQRRQPNKRREQWDPDPIQQVFNSRNDELQENNSIMDFDYIDIRPENGRVSDSSVVAQTDNVAVDHLYATVLPRSSRCLVQNVHNAEAGENISRSSSSASSTNMGNGISMLDNQLYDGSSASESVAGMNNGRCPDVEDNVYAEVKNTSQMAHTSTCAGGGLCDQAAEGVASDPYESYSFSGDQGNKGRT